MLSIAYPFAPVGPNLVGGAEQILWDVDQALVAAGHRSLVVACEGSKPAGELFAVPLPTKETLEPLAIETRAVIGFTPPSVARFDRQALISFTRTASICTTSTFRRKFRC